MIATTNMGSKLWVGQILVGLILYGRVTPQTLGHNSNTPCNSYYCIMQILNIQILNLLNQHLHELPLVIVIKEEQKISLILFFITINLHTIAIYVTVKSTRGKWEHPCYIGGIFVWLKILNYI